MVIRGNVGQYPMEKRFVKEKMPFRENPGLPDAFHDG
jgi:hypothetical protein